MTSSLRHYDIITVEILGSYKILTIKIRKFKDVSDFKKLQLNGTNWKENIFFETNNSILKNLSCTKRVSPVKV